jgi:hypothetical protein
MVSNLLNDIKIRHKDNGVNIKKLSVPFFLKIPIFTQ